MTTQHETSAPSVTQQRDHTRALLAHLHNLDPEYYDHRTPKGVTADPRRCTYSLAGLAAHYGVGGLYLRTGGGVGLVFASLLTAGQALERVFGPGSYAQLFEVTGQTSTWTGAPGWKAALGALRAWEQVLVKRVDEERTAAANGAAIPPGNAQREYRVRWEIDVEGTSPEAAARAALEIQRDPGSQATVFEVEGQEIDLLARHDTFTTPDCPKCGCVGDGTCLCTDTTADVQTAKPTITADQVLYVDGHTPVVSYGPRRETDTDTVPCHESEAAFWSVFTYDPAGHARILADCVQREDAASVATRVHRQAERVADLVRHNDAQRTQIDHLRSQRHRLCTLLGLSPDTAEALIIDAVRGLQDLHRDAVDRLNRVHEALRK